MFKFFVIGIIGPISYDNDHDNNNKSNWSKPLKCITSFNHTNPKYVLLLYLFYG